MATYPYNYVGPLRPGDSRLPPPGAKNIQDIINPPKNPITEALKKSSGGGGGSSYNAAAQAQARQQSQAQARQQSQAQAQAQKAAADKAYALEILNQQSIANKNRINNLIRAKIINQQLNSSNIRNANSTYNKNLPSASELRGIYNSYQRPKGGYVSELAGIGYLDNKLRMAKNTLVQKKQLGRQLSYKEAAVLVGATIGNSASSIIKSWLDLPETTLKVIRNPSVLKDLPASISRQGAEFGYLLKTAPDQALFQVGTDIVLLYGTSRAIDSLSSVAKAKITKLNPKYVGEARVGENLAIKVSNTKKVNLKVVAKIPKQKLAAQVRLAGRRIDAISSQADNLIGTLKSSRIIKKPIPGEAAFSIETKRLLNKFDRGVITKSEAIKLNSLIKSQKAKGLLERSFFADPNLNIRPSRLGIVNNKKSRFLDYFTEDITFRKPKPQILLFNDVKVASFPKSLSRVASKIKRGITLTKKEASDFLEWQLKQSSNFKPVGFTTAESEVTLAPGTMIKKVKKVGVTTIKGKSVPIIQVRPYLPTGRIKNLLKRLFKNDLSTAEKRTLNNALKRETGFNYGLSSSYKAGAKYIPIKRIGLSGISRMSGISRGPVSRKIMSRGSTSKKYYNFSKSSSSKRITRTSSNGSSKSPNSPRRSGSSKNRNYGSPRQPGKTSRPGKSTTRPRYYGSPKSPYIFRKSTGIISPLLITPKSFTRTTLSRSQPTFYVVEKVRGKFRKLYPKPLALKDARDYAVYSIDNRLSKTAFFVPLGRSKRVVVPPRQIQNYASRNSFKVRPYRIRFGKKRQLVNGFIEKRKYFQDTSGEKRALRIARRMSPASRKIMLRNLSKARAVRSGSNIRSSPRMVRRNRPIRRVQIKLSPQRRRQLILQLKKARMVRMRNLRRRR